MIYDDFARDPEWQELKELYELPTTTYRERVNISSKMAAIEDKIRAEGHQYFKDLCAGYGKGQI